MNALSGYNFSSVLNLKSFKVDRSSNRTVLVGERKAILVQLVDIFWNEAYIELVKTFVQESSQTNHVSREPPFSPSKAPPAKRDGLLWGHLVV